LMVEDLSVELSVSLSMPRRFHIGKIRNMQRC
jgi:hypothetical protein